MNLKTATLIRAILPLALLLPLTGCGNKGPLTLRQSPPPAQADVLPAMPPVGDMIPPAEPVPTDAVPAAPAPTDDVPANAPPAPPSGAGGGGDG